MINISGPTRRKLHAIHSWIGVSTSLALFVIVVTGIFAVFARTEIAQWADPSIHEQRPSPFSAEQVVRTAQADYLTQHKEHGLIILFMPRRGSSAGHVSIASVHGNAASDDAHQDKHHHPGVVYRFDSVTGQLTNTKTGDVETIYKKNWTTPLSSFLVHLHTDLWLPAPWGRYATGFLGLTLLVSAVSGLIIHRQIFKEALSFTWRTTAQRRWKQIHKLAGLWTSVFTIVIGFTGALLSFATALLLPIVAIVSFGGDMERIEATFVGVGAASGAAQQTSNLDTLLQDVSERSPKFRPTLVHLHHFDDARAVVDVSGYEGGGVSLVKYRFDGTTSELTKRLDGISDEAAFSRPLAIALALHFGDFGGYAIKFLWSLLATLMALMLLAGTMMWIERRSDQSVPLLAQRYRLLSRLTVGVTGGLLFALGAVICFAPISTSIAPDSTLPLRIAFSTSCLFGIGLPFLWSSMRVSAIALTALCGLVFAAAPFSKTVFLGDSIIDAYANGRMTVVAIDMLWLVTGALFLATSFLLNRTRLHPQLSFNSA
ncbi:MAG: PepSY-associated TM helix domain-containing protein [Pseudomonadota bacterium]